MSYNKPKQHIWPFEGTAHPVGKAHKNAPEGSKHWQDSEFVIADNKYEQGK